jgi:membrane-bound ClpP family serine protease
VTLITTGLILLISEVIIPGGILGIIGGILLFIGSALSFAQFGTGYGLLALTITTLAAATLFYIQFKILPKTAIGKHYFLKSEITASSSILKHEFAELIGKPAIAATILSPSGYITIGDKQYEAVSQSGLIQKYTELTVTSATPFQLTVKIKN